MNAPSFGASGVFHFICRDPAGGLKWKAELPNTLTLQGLNHLLDVGVCGTSNGSYLTWYIGLTDTALAAATADTMASHAGWTEITAYAAATKPEWSEVRSNQTVSNSASKASYVMNDACTVTGAFICSDSTKGTTGGVLMCVVAAGGGDQVCASADTLTVQYNMVFTAL